MNRTSRRSCLLQMLLDLISVGSAVDKHFVNAIRCKIFKRVINKRNIGKWEQALGLVREISKNYKLA